VAAPFALSGRPLAMRPGRPWSIVLPIIFALGSADFALAGFLDPRSIGSHALIYTDAARAWLTGGNPWTVGPPGAVFAGPPTMLLPFVPFVPLPGDVTRLIWVGGSVLLAAFVLRRLNVPGWWIGFRRSSMLSCSSIQRSSFSGCWSSAGFRRVLRPS